MGKVYVRCRVLSGLFDSELYVLVNGESSAYVTRSFVRMEGNPTHTSEVDGEVLAYIIKRNGGKSLIELPGEVVAGGLRTWVPDTMLAPA
jgi:hypothetical protein